jgi:protein SHQ1
MRQLEINGKWKIKLKFVIDFYLDQPKENLVSSYSYGFNQQYKEIFSNFDSEYSLIFDNQSPDTLSPSLIRSSRLDKEEKDFNVEHYFADKYDESIFDYKLILDQEFNDQDRDDLKNLKFKQLLINDPIPIYLGLIDLIYAFVYDQRMTQ